MLSGWPWTHLDITVKSMLYVFKCLPPEVQILVCFALGPALFEIEGCWKLENQNALDDDDPEH